MTRLAVHWQILAALVLATLTAVNIYSDFLCALYRKQDNSERVLAYRGTMTEPLHLTRLLLWEFWQSVRFQKSRHRQEPQLDDYCLTRQPEALPL